MADRIAVTVYRTKQRKNYLAQWVDPASGRKKTRTTGTPIKREALRYAGKLESELNAGTYQQKQRTEWKDFRQRFERDYLFDKSSSTNHIFRSLFLHVETILNPHRLASIDAGAIRRMSRKMRESGKREATIKCYLKHLKVAVRWAHRNGMLNAVPEIELPKKSMTAKGRAVTGEELERMIEAVPKSLYPKRKDGQERDQDPEVVDSWKHLLHGLYWSGLRLGEAMNLHWTDSQKMTVDLSGRYPMFLIHPDGQKSGKEQTLPMAPEFAEFLQAIPESQREGFVFNPLQVVNRGRRMRRDNVSQRISDIGEKAGVKVAETTAGKPRFATAHDLRRSFGFRWSSRVMPPILREMMRHADISTTMNFYISQNAEATAEAIWSSLAKHSAKREDSGQNHDQPAKL